MEVDGDDREGVDGEVRAARDRVVDDLDGAFGDVGEGDAAVEVAAPEVEVIRRGLLTAVPPPLAASGGGVDASGS